MGLSLIRLDGFKRANEFGLTLPPLLLAYKIKNKKSSLIRLMFLVSSEPSVKALCETLGNYLLKQLSLPLQIFMLLYN